jgi:hypothetical protein
MLLVSATGDWTKNVPQDEYPAIRSIYELYHRPDNLSVVQFQAEHNFNRQSREAVYDFLAKYLRDAPPSSKSPETSIEPEPLLSMLVWQGRALPSNALTQKQLFEQWKSSRRRSVAALDPSTRRSLMLDTFHAEWPARVLSEHNGESLVLSRPARGDRVPGLWLPGKRPVTVVVHPDGAEAARRDSRVADLTRAGQALLLLDVFQTGSAVAPRHRGVKFYLTFNASDDANRVQDILTALAYLDEQHFTGPVLLGIGKAAGWVRFAKAMAPIIVSVAPETPASTCSDEEFQRNLFVPGIQLLPCPAEAAHP